MLTTEKESNLNIVDIPPLELNFIFPFEKLFFGYEQSLIDWFSGSFHIPIALSIVYLIAIYYGRRFMVKRPSYDLRKILIAWNLLLAIFSFMGSIRVLPFSIYVLNNFGFKASVCHSYGYSGVNGFWGAMFVLSKPLELGDTVFIILRKQPLIFLHWYHHITVLLFSWWIMGITSATGRWFFTMNYIVHAVMYSYYACRAARLSVPKQASILVTLLQILQMVAGTVVIIYALIELQIKQEFCQTSTAAGIIGLLMYLSFFILFARFFYNSYLSTKPASKQISDGKDNKFAQQNGDSQIIKPSKRQNGAAHLNGSTKKSN